MAWSGKRLCAFCHAVRRQAYIQYSLWPARHASPSHIHLSTPRHRPLQQFYQFISTDKTGVKLKEYSIGLFAAQSAAYSLCVKIEIYCIKILCLNEQYGIIYNTNK